MPQQFLQHSYPTLTSLPARGPLPPMVGVIVPIARTNLVTNPSFELGATTGYTNTGTSITISTQFQYHGLYSLQVAPSATVNTGCYYTISLTAGVTYAISAKFICMEPTLGTTYVGKQMKLWLGDTSGNVRAVTSFVSTGRWQWITLIYTETTSTSRRIYFTKGDVATADAFCIDGVQCEAITDGILQATTYIDGDQIGLLPGQQPPPYGWNGTPHASTSYRTILTRAGGYVMNWQQAYGFLLTGMIGLGMAAPNNVSIPYSVLDGARFIRTTKPPRTISFPGRFQADDNYGQMLQQSAMRAVLDRDLSPLQQPLVLFVEPQDDCGNATGDFATLQCIYAGGLEGNESNFPIEEAAPTFSMYVPFLIGGDDGSALIVQQTLTNANAIVQRSPTGTWRALSTGMSGGTPSVLALNYGADGTLYAGGNFTNAGSSGADYIAKWDGASWAVLKSATSINGIVRAIATGPDGRIYVGGDFTNADGIAAADYIAVYNPTADTWAALGTGAGNLAVYALAFDTLGRLWAGGGFPSMGGVANTQSIAVWNGTAWASVGTVAGGTSIVNVLRSDGRGGMYAGGNFTAIGAVTIKNVGHWRAVTSAWVAMATTMNAGVYGMAVAPGGDLIVSGDFTTIDGQTVAYIARNNGSGWFDMASGFNLGAYWLEFDRAGMLYAGGAFTTAGGFTLPDKGARWNGSSWLPLDTNFPGSATVFAIKTAPDGTLTIGYNTAGSPLSAALTTVNNDTKNIVYPVLVLTGPTSGTSTVFQLVNETTGAGLYFKLTLQTGETATLITDPQNASFTSSFVGDLTNTILPGSALALMYLAPGDNIISLYASGSTTTALLSWHKRYSGLADLVR